MNCFYLTLSTVSGQTFLRESCYGINQLDWDSHMKIGEEPKLWIHGTLGVLVYFFFLKRIRSSHDMVFSCWSIPFCMQKEQGKPGRRKKRTQTNRASCSSPAWSISRPHIPGEVSLLIFSPAPSVTFLSSLLPFLCRQKQNVVIITERSKLLLSSGLELIFQPLNGFRWTATFFSKASP